MKIFSDRAYLVAGKGHVVMLFPFWGKNPEDPGEPNSGRFDRYAQLGHSYFRMAELAEADIAVYPAQWEHAAGDAEARGRALHLAEQAREAGKPVAIFFWSDSAEAIPIENAVLFRTSLYRSTRKPREFAMPAWSEDFVERYLGSQLMLRSKRERPVVGFCGYADPPGVPLLRRAKRAGGSMATLLGVKKPGGRRAGAAIRAQAMRRLSKSSLVETNFVLRDGFLGGAYLSNGGTDLSIMQRVRREYVQNMVDSDYILCTRGGGNFSYRLYETLSCGRIPIFIDTDCVLPYHSEIDWKRYCVWVDERQIDSIADRVVEFHAALSAEGLVELQRECRKLWEEWLSPMGFFANFHRHFAPVPLRHD